MHDRLTMVEESQRSTERDVELMREVTEKEKEAVTS